MKNSLQHISPSGIEIQKGAMRCHYAYEDIIAIETEKPYLMLYTTTEKVLFSGSLSSIRLHAPAFICQSNKSAIINLLYVKSWSIAGNSCTANTPAKPFLIARRRRNEIMQLYSRLKLVLDKEGICQHCKLKHLTD